MNTKYVPIMRWKTGEKNCLINLTPAVTEQIIPFVEVSPPQEIKDDKDANKKLANLYSSFNKYWGNKPFYLYLSPNWFSASCNVRKFFKDYEDFYYSIKHADAIPAFDVLDESNIKNAANLTKAKGVCLRIRANNFAKLGGVLNNYIANSWITPQNTDLLIDLEYTCTDKTFKKSTLTTALSNITRLADYRQIIIASNSFPEDISSLSSYMIHESARLEVETHEVSKDLQREYGFNYVYADYGPMNLKETPYVLGMFPKVKIKYTTKDKYLFIIGESTKKGGLDLPNIVHCCTLLVNHRQYSGSNFSYGDKVISDIANGTNTKSGNLASWIGYSFNHHITLIVAWL